MPYAIGIDIGGTKTDLALVTDDGSVISENRIPTEADQGGEALIDRIAAALTALRAGYPEVLGVGVCTPGHVDTAAGVVRSAVNLGWREFAIRDALEARIPDLSAAVYNDVKVGALGEARFGAARGVADFVYIALGTGLGGGAVVGGTLVRGANAFAMDIGHLALTPGGRLCRCGLHGCPEAYVSGVGLANGIAAHHASYPDTRLALSASTHAILDAFAQGDALAVAVMEEAADQLAQLMAIAACWYNPALIILGGGLGIAAADFWLDRARRIVPERTLPQVHAGLRFVPAAIHRPAVSAASLVFTQGDLSRHDQ